MTGFEVHVDAAALADMERAEEAARAHVAAVRSAGGKAGGTATVASHGPQLANGGKATVASHGPQLANGGTTSMSGEHAPRIHSAGGTAGLGKIRKDYKKPNQTAHQQATAAYKRKYRAAKRAAEAKVRVE